MVPRLGQVSRGHQQGRAGHRRRRSQEPGGRRAVTRHTQERRGQSWDGDNAEDISLYGHTGGAGDRYSGRRSAVSAEHTVSRHRNSNY